MSLGEWSGAGAWKRTHGCAAGTGAVGRCEEREEGSRRKDCLESIGDKRASISCLPVTL